MRTLFEIDQKDYKADGTVYVRPSVREYGMVHRVQKGIKEDMFVQDNYYYLCDVEDVAGTQKLDAYEAEEEFVLEWVNARHAVEVNRGGKHFIEEIRAQYTVMVEREARVLVMLMEEGIVGDL